MVPNPETDNAKSLDEPEHQPNADRPRRRISFRLVMEQLGSCGPVRLPAAERHLHATNASQSP